MDLISYDEFKNTSDYNDFAKNNTSIGHLKIQVFTAYQAIPIENTEILVTKDINGKKIIFFEGLTNSSGIVEDIQLPTPKNDVIAELFETPVYETYELTAINTDYENIQKFNINMYDTKIIQYIKMIPKSQ